MKYLVQLEWLLSCNLPINGYTDEAAERKRIYEKTGKRAMQELASLLDLVEYDISFNRSGVAGSGDLRLMGFNRHGKGVYITMNKEMGSGLEVLYRTIEHMMDFTGGRNHWFSFAELGTPEILKKRIESLHEEADIRSKFAGKEVQNV